jgi:predicted short-subunit dehydrogenase-like oxidoreductase (DUF2520 family)
MSASSTPSVSDAHPIAIVGAGAVGSAIARRLHDLGDPIAAVLSRRATSARALADRVGAPVASSTVAALPERTRFVLLCVPDDAIGPVAERLADVAHPWADTVAAHTSGARPASELAALARRGAAPLSFHPMQTFAQDTAPSAFDGIVIGLEGSDAALSVGSILARHLGGTPVRLSASDKIRYHCAAALASNGLVALLSVVREVLATAGIEGERARQLVRPLVDQTWENLQAEAPASVLTGPVARDDRGTVEAHVEALAEAQPHLIPLYAALSEEMVRLAERDDRLDPSQAQRMRDLLRAARTASGDASRSSNASR